jgi:hypothetical protein
VDTNETTDEAHGYAAPDLEARLRHREHAHHATLHGDRRSQLHQRLRHRADRDPQRADGDQK